MTAATLSKTQFLKKWGELVLIPILVPFDPESRGPEEGRPIDANELWDMLNEKSRRYDPADVTEETTLEDLKIEVEDRCDAINVYTKDELKHLKAEKERKELENFVARIGQEAGAKDVYGQLDALHRLIDRQESYREGMREDGLCIGWGVTTDQWCEEMNYSRGESAYVDRAIDWIRQNCPLAYAKWQEQRQQQQDGE